MGGAVVDQLADRLIIVAYVCAANPKMVKN